MNRSIWLIVRVAAIAFWIVGGIQMDDRTASPPARLLLPLGLVAFGAAAASFWWSLSRAAYPAAISMREPGPRWYQPRWNSWGGIPDFFHLGGWCFVSMGTSSMLRALVSGGNFIGGILALSFGAGTILGVRLALPARSDADRSTAMPSTR